MSYIGTTKIGKMFLGSTEIAKAYLGSDLVFQKGGVTPLPYDAEIEYLRSTGTQYIDTGLYGDNALDYEVRVSIALVSSSTFYNVLGDRLSSSEKRFSLMLYARNTNSSHVYFNSGDANEVKTSSQAGSTVSGWHTYSKDASDVFMDSNKVGTLEQQTYTTPNTIILFGARNSGSLSNMLTGNISYCKFSRGGVLLRDFIPVRIGTIGYMYDRVSGQLFGNAGTGAFTLGADKNI